VISGTQELVTDRRLMDCIDHALDAFGESFKYVIYFNMQQLENVDRDSIPQKPASFSETLDRMFGAGSHSVKRRIMDELSQDFRVSERQEDLVSMIKSIRR
jgi:hypothetical protein